MNGATDRSTKTESTKFCDRATSPIRITTRVLPPTFLARESTNSLITDRPIGTPGLERQPSIILKPSPNANPSQIEIGWVDSASVQRTPSPSPNKTQSPSPKVYWHKASQITSPKCPTSISIRGPRKLEQHYTNRNQEFSKERCRRLECQESRRTEYELVRAPIENRNGLSPPKLVLDPSVAVRRTRNPDSNGSPPSGASHRGVNTTPTNPVLTGIRCINTTNRPCLAWCNSCNSFVYLFQKP